MARPQTDEDVLLDLAGRLLRDGYTARQEGPAYVPESGATDEGYVVVGPDGAVKLRSARWTDRWDDGEEFDDAFWDLVESAFAAEGLGCDVRAEDLVRAMGAAL